MEDRSSKHPDSKIFYSPIEIAVRWCNLPELETQILREALTSHQGAKPSAPACIREKLDILWDAMLHGELNYGYHGVTVPFGTCIDPSLVTIRHADLKRWLSAFFPSEKPSFLFSGLEKLNPNENTANLINVLIGENNLLKILCENSKNEIEVLKVEIQDLQKENAKLKNLHRQSRKPAARNERAYLQLIGTLVNLFLAKTPSGKPYSPFTSQASIISALMAHNRNKAGFSQRTLEEKFAAARRSIDDSG